MQRTMGLLFGALFLGAAFFHQPREYDNTTSRYMLLSAMVDEGRFTIDSTQQDTVDKSVWRGHYYSNKAIGLPFLAAPVYWVLRRSGAVARVLDDPAADYFVRLAVVTLPFALTGLLLFQFALSLGAEPRGAAWATIAFAFGTIAFNHAVLFSGHDTAAFFLFLSFVVLYQAGRKEASRGARSTALSLIGGLCAGLAVLCDHIAVFAAVVLAWYAFSSVLKWRAKLAFAAGAAACAAVLAWYDLSCFGSVWSLAYAHNDFVEFNRGASAGIFGIALPRASAAVALLFSVSRGLFFISPVLIFSIAGFSALGKTARSKRELAVLALVPAAIFIANAGFYGWDGGWTFGPRYLAPALPFLCAPLALAADGGVLFALTLALSVLQVACAQIGWPHVAPVCANPLVEMILPLMKEGGVSLTLLGGARPGLLWPGLAQYALIIAACAGALWSLPSSRPARAGVRWNALAGVWSLWIVLALAFTRTNDQSLVHFHRAILLNDAAWVLGGTDLAGKANAEFALAGRPRDRQSAR